MGIIKSFMEGWRSGERVLTVQDSMDEPFEWENDPNWGETVRIALEQQRPRLEEICAQERAEREAKLGPSTGKHALRLNGFDDSL